MIGADHVIYKKSLHRCLDLVRTFLSIDLMTVIAASVEDSFTIHFTIILNILKKIEN